MTMAYENINLPVQEEVSLFLACYSFMKQVTNSLKDQTKLLFGKDNKVKLFKSMNLNSSAVNWKSFQIIVTKLIENVRIS